MKLQGKKVLVTGAGGFIGSHLTERLTLLGARVRAFVRYNSRNDFGLLEYFQEDLIDQVEIFTGDLRDPEAVRTSARGMDAIFHLGAIISIPYSYINPGDVLETNVMGTLNLLNAARSAEVEKFIHTSTSEVYGTARYAPIDEDHPLQGQSPYSASKIAADKLAESYHRSFEMPIATVRPFNTYGPGQSARAVIPTIITQALTRNEIHLGSLHPTRDLTFVDDTVEGFIHVAKSDKTCGEVINLGTNQEISIGDLARKIGTVIGKELDIVSDEKRVRPRESEVERLISNNEKASRLASWTPVVSIEEGIGKTVEWIERHLDMYKSYLYNV